MAVSQNFLDYMLDQFSAWENVSTRRMFGGAGLFRDGKMFGLVANDVAYLKVDETNKAKFLVAGSVPFRLKPDKPAMPYFEIPPNILENPHELIEWAAESLAIQKKSK